MVAIFAKIIGSVLKMESFFPTVSQAFKKNRVEKSYALDIFL